MDSCTKNGRRYKLFIEKKGRKAIRPISMSSCISKILERMINERLIWLAEREGWFDENQNGFRRGRSCVDNLVRLVSDIEISKESDQNLIAVILDVKSAYNNVRIDLLCDRLVSKEYPVRIFRYIEQWMRDRITKFSIGDDREETRLVNKGFPQGGVLSPTLYNIYTSELSASVKKNIHVIQYADDIAIYTTCNDLLTGRIEMEVAINSLEKKLNKLGLELEANKTNVMIFNNRPDRDNKIRIRMKGMRLDNVRTAKFLGITFDSKVKIEPQLAQIQVKADKALNLLRYTCRVTWGMETNTALMIYKSYVRSILEYGLFVFYPRDYRGKEKWEKIQNKGLRIAMGYRNSTPINVMIAESEVDRLRDRAGLLPRNYWTKIVSRNGKKTIARMN